jgi:hypothetical protein
MLHAGRHDLTTPVAHAKARVDRHISRVLSFHATLVKEQIILCAMSSAENLPSFAARLFNEIASS